MNKVWTRYEGLILTDWQIGEKVPLENKLLVQSLMSALRTGVSILYNDKSCVINLTSLL